MKTLWPIHYRIIETLEPNGVLVKALEFTPIKETPKGYWVIGRYAQDWLSDEELIKRKIAKWVGKGSIKRRCYPKIEDAMASFKRRKECQVSRLRLQLEQAELALAKFDTYKDDSAGQLKLGIYIGDIPSAAGLNWDY